MKNVLKLLGIRQRVILCRFNNIAKEIAIMISISDEQVEELEKNESIVINNKVITRDKIFCYGNIDLNNEEDVSFIKKFNLITDDYTSNTIHSGFDYEKAVAEYEGKIPKTYSIDDVLLWFKYNYVLIGKPKNILIYKCRQHDL